MNNLLPASLQALGVDENATPIAGEQPAQPIMQQPAGQQPVQQQQMQQPVQPVQQPAPQTPQFPLIGQQPVQPQQPVMQQPAGQQPVQQQAAVPAAPQQLQGQQPVQQPAGQPPAQQQNPILAQFAPQPPAGQQQQAAGQQPVQQPPVLAHDAKVQIQGPDGSLREVAVSEIANFQDQQAALQGMNGQQPAPSTFDHAKTLTTVQQSLQSRGAVQMQQQIDKGDALIKQAQAEIEQNKFYAEEWRNHAQQETDPAAQRDARARAVEYEQTAINKQTQVMLASQEVQRMRSQVDDMASAASVEALTAYYPNLATPQGVNAVGAAAAQIYNIPAAEFQSILRNPVYASVLMDGLAHRQNLATANNGLQATQPLPQAIIQQATQPVAQPVMQPAQQGVQPGAVAGGQVNPNLVNAYNQLAQAFNGNNLEQAEMIATQLQGAMDIPAEMLNDLDGQQPSWH